MRKTAVTNWELIGRDDTGAMATLDYTCPYCGTVIPDFRFFDADTSDLSMFDGDFEFDAKCEWCQKSFIVECHQESRLA